ncbi:MAG TPA: acyltransferase [Thermomicrobiales bacterium]|jgi:acetyltransferase-like isoleucine patch superfamily enzyme
MSVERRLAHDWFAQPLPPNVVIGERSWLYSTFAFGHYRSQRPCGVRIGHDSGIYIGTIFDLGPVGELQIGNFCTINGPIIATNRRIVIEDYALISFGVVIADSFAAVPPRSMHRVESRGEGQHTGEPSIVIGENAWIGARAVLLAGARIGRGAIVGAATVVDFDVPPFAIAAGNPARIVGSTRP